MTNIHPVAGTRNGHAPETRNHGHDPGTQNSSRSNWAHEQGALLHAELEQRVERETAALRAEWRRDRLIAEALQRSLLLASSPPILPGLGVEVASEVFRPEAPVGQGVLIGSDFADVIPLAGGRVALVVGDVCGKGLAALCVPQTLYALRLIPSEHPHPVGALGQVAVHVALTESGEGHAAGVGPAGEAADLDLVVELRLPGARGLQVEQELAARLVPGERDAADRRAVGAVAGSRRSPGGGEGGTADDICDRFTVLVMIMCQQQQGR